MKKTTIGGQALLEGVMMKGPESVAIAIRKSDGEIVLTRKLLSKVTKKGFFKLPVVRGIVEFWRIMVIGVKAIMYSADFIELEDEEEAKPSRIDAFINRVFGDKIKDAVIYFAVILSLAFSIGLFILLPNIVAGFLHFNKKTVSGLIYYNLFEGALRLGLFVGYLALTSMLKDIQRVWQYHGAEHKTISCYEHEEELTVENVRKYTTRHPRCGTSFMFIVMIVSILVFSFVGWYHPIINVLLRLLLIPVVAGISYEILKFAGRSDGIISRILRAPGMALQGITTREPDDKQIEVAIEAFKNVMVEDREADVW